MRSRSFPPFAFAGLLLPVAFTLALIAHPPSAVANEAPRPNIVFILADDLGYGDLGCYGQKQILTPHLDQMAAEGMKFTHCYAGSTVCAPSRCALMTGRHTGHCTVRGNALVPLRPEDITVAELLKEANYATALIGKWGLGEPGSTGIPNRQGFDDFFGYLNQRHAHNSYPDYLWKNEEKVRLPGNVLGPVDNVSIKTGQHSHDLFTEEALNWLGKQRTQPFFLYLAYTIPHANNERGRAEGDGMEVPSDAPYSDKPWPQPQKSHAAMITRLDRDVGRLFARLKELGLDENTIVFFTSDNGPHKEGGADPKFFNSSGPLQGFKRSLHDGGIRVPMLVRWPGHIRPGTVNDHVWALWDFLPTAAELAGVKAPAEIDGLSIVPTLLGEEGQKQHEFLYWEFHEGGSKQAVRMGDWKAVREKPGAPLELFNLQHDISEAHDIAAKHPEIVQKIEAYLAHARTESKEWPLKAKK